jgi:magnesium transporter
MTDTAAAHLTRRVPRARAGETVSVFLSQLPGQVFDSAETVYIVDDTGRLLGTVAMTAVLRAEPERDVAELMSGERIAVQENRSERQLADLAVRHRLLAVPVVSANGELLGGVPPSALLTILRHEHLQDLHRLVGIRHQRHEAIRALEGTPRYRVLHRLPWLLLGLMGSVIATVVMAGYERVLENRIAIAFFIPAIVYLADAIGTQTEAIAVRGIALSHARLRALLAREIATGLIIGAALGAVAMLGVLLVYHDVRLAAAVSLAILAAGAAAAALGLLLPWTLARRGKDPAFGSGPVATVMQDVASLIIYLAIAQLLLG